MPDTDFQCLGSTNRRAGPEMIAEIRLLSRNTFFDEQPRTEISSEEVDFRAASELFAAVSRPLNSPERKSLGLVVEYRGQEVPTNAADDICLGHAWIKMNENREVNKPTCLPQKSAAKLPSFLVFGINDQLLRLIEAGIKDWD